MADRAENIADEIVEVYLTQLAPLDDGPLRHLVGFGKVSLNPGEQKKMMFTIDPTSWGRINSP